MAGSVVLATLEHAWSTLAPLNAPMAVMGGLALAAWEHVRATQDVDLLIGVDEQRAQTLIERLGGGGFVPKQSWAMQSLGDLRLVQALYTPPGRFVDVRLDVLLADSEYHRQALARRVDVRLPGVQRELFVLACEDLVLYKLLAGRIVDRADCIALLSANRATLDRRYLREWAGNLGVMPALVEAWTTALPGEAIDASPRGGA